VRITFANGTRLSRTLVSLTGHALEVERHGNHISYPLDDVALVERKSHAVIKGGIFGGRTSTFPRANQSPMALSWPASVRAWASSWARSSSVWPARSTSSTPVSHQRSPSHRQSHPEVRRWVLVGTGRPDRPVL